MSIVTLRDVRKSFGAQVVLEGLNLSLYAGQKVGMVGPNGSGKTTILRLLRGDIQPDLGQITRQKGLRVGFLRQEAVFDDSLTVMEQMHAGLA